MKDQKMLLMIALVQQEKIRNNFSKLKTKFLISLHYNGGESYFYVKKLEVCKFKANDNTH